MRQEWLRLKCYSFPSHCPEERSTTCEAQTLPDTFSVAGHSTVRLKVVLQCPGGKNKPSVEHLKKNVQLKGRYTIIKNSPVFRKEKKVLAISQPQSPVYMEKNLSRVDGLPAYPRYSFTLGAPTFQTFSHKTKSWLG